MVEGMSALINIETRIRIESRNVNYSGFNVDASQTAYMDFQTAKGTTKAAKLGAAAEAMAEDIKAAFETGLLTEMETTHLKGLITEIVGDAELAHVYVFESVDGDVEGRYNNAKSSIYANQNTRHTNEVVIEFNYNDKHDEVEFARQLKNQEAGMNQLTIDEYLRNRERYTTEGRSEEGNALKQAFRAEVFSKKIHEFRKTGMSFEQATEQAQLWLDSQAVLHYPDQIAGGNPLKIGGMGDAGINSSIGDNGSIELVLSIGTSIILYLVFQGKKEK